MLLTEQMAVHSTVHWGAVEIEVGYLYWNTSEEIYPLIH